MFITEKKGPRQTKWPKPASEDARIAPKHGWDNEDDVREGTRICRDMYGALNATERSKGYAFDLGVKLYNQGISRRVACDLIMQFTKPQLSRGDIELEVWRAYDTAVNVPGLMSLARPDVRIDNWLDGGGADDEDLSWLEGGITATWPHPIEYDRQKNASICAAEFLSFRPEKLISSDSVLYTFAEKKVWRAITDHEIAAEIRASDPTMILDVPKIQMMVRAIHLSEFTPARPFEWIEPGDAANAPEPNDLILASNGILNFKTGELLPHSPLYFATGLPNWDYDPDAKCPLWMEKLSEWLHPSYHPTLQQFAGYLLTPDTSIEVLLAMIGVRRGGKGSITRILQALVGKQHHASVMLNDLAGEYGLAGMMDKRAIFIPDAHDAATNHRTAALERIKSITGNDDISVNRKFMPMLTARIPAKIVLVANSHPRFLDESGALAVRELVLEFNTSFAANMDTGLREKLMAELSGIAGWAIEGLRQLRAQGRFTVGELGAKAQRNLAESQSPARRFARDSLIVTGDSNDFVPLDVVFPAYEHWASFIESLGTRQKRDRDGFKTDLMAVLAERGVRYTRKR